MRGVIAAGHPLTARAGADVLEAGGNAVDAALAAMMASFAAEPLLTGLGAGGYMLVAGPEAEPVLLDFFVAAPGPARAALVPVTVSFGDAAQVFHAGAASCGVWGNPAGIAEAHARYASMSLLDLAQPAIRLARDGVPINAAQGYIFEVLADILSLTEAARARFWTRGRVAAQGDVLDDPALADSLRLLGEEGAAPFYKGEVAQATVAHLTDLGGGVTMEDLADYAAIPRAPVRVCYRGTDVITNPPPSAGGILIAYALALLERVPAPPTLTQLLGAIEAAQDTRTPAFVEGLDRPGFLDEFLSSNLGSTTHISVLDGSGLACSVTCTNGEGSGVVVPGTGMHLNNIMGEEDLSPLGFFTYARGRRMPSMMAPTMVLEDGAPSLVLGSAGSNRIRSAILRVISEVLDCGRPLHEAVIAPRVHWENGTTYAEPGLDLEPLRAEGRTLAPFRAPNIFFGGVQAVARTGEGAGDPRRGGAAITVP